MGRKKKKDKDIQSEQELQIHLERLKTKTYPRSLNRRDRGKFEIVARSYACLAHHDAILKSLRIPRLDDHAIRHHLAYDCQTIEHQIVALRSLTLLTKKDLVRRRFLTQSLMNCLHRHHRVIYEGIMFGSTINGLGFRDSDIDLRLRPLRHVSSNTLEPVHYDKEFTERTLRNIAFQTTRCAPAIGEFVPSSRCPIAKLTFLTGDPKDAESYEDGANYDISLSSTNHLGTFNSIYMRFLCQLQPKFHLLATVLRYWSKAHKLILSGYLSSYALVNMLILFCQTTSPPLLPTVDQMREIYLARKPHRGARDERQALLQLEWNCLLSLDRNSYPPSENEEPVSVLLLKFFEMYLNFPYATHILTTRTGRALTVQEFKASPLHHPKFPVKSYINIQDPFDLKHNLTSGMNGPHFNTLIITMRYSYERLCRELLTNFLRPDELNDIVPMASELQDQTTTKKNKPDDNDLERWGLNSIFTRITAEEMNSAH